MKILHVSGARSWGGNEQQLVNIVSNLDAKAVVNFVFGVANTDLHNTCMALGISFIACKGEKLNSIFNYKYFKAIVKKHQPEIIHLHTSDALTVFTISDLMFKLNRPTVYSKKAVSGSKSNFFRRYKFNYKGVNKIISVSKIVQDKLIENTIYKSNIKKLSIIYDGVDIHQKIQLEIETFLANYNVPKNKFIIGHIANHTRAKDLTTLVETIHYLVNVLNMTAVHVVQVGDSGKDTKRFNELLKQYDLSGYFTLVGFYPQAINLHKIFDVFLMTSEREGGPTAVLEAMLYKTPVVSTSVGIVPEIITANENGIVCNVKDFKGLANGLSSIHKDEALGRTFALRSEAIVVENFSFEKIADDHYKLYNEMLRNAEL